MSDLDELWQTIITRVHAVPAVSSVKPPGAKSTVAAVLASDDLADSSPGSTVLVQEQDAVTEIEVNIGVFAELSAGATGLAVGQAIVDVLDANGVEGRQVIVRVLSVGHMTS